jgi:hypothetical protein
MIFDTGIKFYPVNDRARFRGIRLEGNRPHTILVPSRYTCTFELLHELGHVMLPDGKIEFY